MGFRFYVLWVRVHDLEFREYVLEIGFRIPKTPTPEGSKVEDT